MLSLARKVIIPKGHNEAKIPRISSVSTVQTPSDGAELSSYSRFTLSSTTIAPTFRADSRAGPHPRAELRAGRTWYG